MRGWVAGAVDAARSEARAEPVITAERVSEVSSVRMEKIVVGAARASNAPDPKQRTTGNGQLTTDL